MLANGSVSCLLSLSVLISMIVGCRGGNTYVSTILFAAAHFAALAPRKEAPALIPSFLRRYSSPQVVRHQTSCLGCISDFSLTLVDDANLPGSWAFTEMWLPICRLFGTLEWISSSSLFWWVE